ncbi:NRDE family protein [Indibacter alkaliphilus]|uniref:NRDE family protein n=1 Tax=Indibacter alkaliphilus TaxID=579922 RepID=UPI00058E4A02|nr:NRDE family protein [Indibacter alkaliphilus]
MCLLAFNWNNHPKYKLILVANRDEFFERPSQSLHQWESGIYAGKDLRAGGTWLGMHPSGRFAALTNYRDLKNPKKYEKSRGDLVKNFLEGDKNPYEYLKEIAAEMQEYEGFNLLVGDQNNLYYLSNKSSGGIKQLSPGIYGLSNAVLETPWRKLVKAKENLEEHLAEGNFQMESLMKGQHSKETESPELLPDTGATPEQEILLSAQFINVGNYYGTVNSTVLLWDEKGQVEMMERVFDQVKGTHEDTKVDFKINSKLEQNVR